MGVVYRCHREADGLEVAVKTVCLDDPTDVNAMRREIHALSKLSHPNIVRVLDRGVTSSFHWYAMEFVPGRTLRSVFEARRGTPPSVQEVDLALGALLDVCEGLAYMHSHGIVHRDLKPENILVRPDGSAVIVDFGIASAFAADPNREALASLVRSAGTAFYMPPEQVLGQMVDPRADLYSLGCILYEALTGRPPFQALDVLAIAWRQVHDPPVHPATLAPDVAPELAALTLRLLEKRPQNRPGYADAVARTLAAHLGRPLGARTSVPPYLYRPQLFGRRALLARASERVRDARGEHGGILLVTGESGVGKTRLMVEVATLASAQGMQVLSGACLGVDARHEAEVRAGPFHPLASTFTALADLCRADLDMVPRLLGTHGRVLAEYVPELTDVIDAVGLPALPSLSPRTTRERALDVVRDSVLALADTIPLFLVIDDLQWADELTMEFLTRLAHTDLTGHKLLVMGSWRSEESTPALDALASHPSVEALHLPRLDRRAVTEMVRDMLALEDVPEALTSFVYEQSDGNPFFVAEYLRAAATESVLTRDEIGRWHLRLPDDALDTILGSVRQPRTVDALILRRITGLAPLASQVMRLAAVLGREFDAEVLMVVTELDEEPYLSALHELRAREIVEEGRGNRLRFVHDRLREVAYASIPEAERPALHRRTAREIERRGVSPNELGALAWHFARAGDHAHAARHFVRAGDHARGVWASREAIDHYQHAITHLLAGGIAGDEVPCLRERIADLQDLLARHEEARAGFERCLAEVPVRCVVWRARLHRKRARTFEAQHLHAEALRAYNEAMRELGSEPPPTPSLAACTGGPEHPPGADAWWFEWVQVHTDRAWVHYWLAQPDEMRALIARVAPVVETRGTALQQARFYLAIVHSDSRETRYRMRPDTEAMARRSLEAAEAAGDLAGIAYARFIHGMVLLFTERFEDAMEAFVQALTDAEHVGDLTLQLRCLNYQMVLRRRQGDQPETRALARRVLTLAERLSMKDYQGAAHACLGWALWREGDPLQATREVHRALSLWHDLADRYAYPLAWLARLPALVLHTPDDSPKLLRAHAQAMLHPTQAAFPARLESALSALAEAPDAQVQSAMDRLFPIACELGYL